VVGGVVRLLGVVGGVGPLVRGGPAGGVGVPFVGAGGVVPLVGAGGVPFVGAGGRVVVPPLRRAYRAVASAAAGWG